MATLINGKELSLKLFENIQTHTKLLKHRVQIKPGLAVVLVGKDPASQIYVRSKMKQAELCGFLSLQKILPQETSQDVLLETLKTLNEDPQIHGILVQLPLPKHINSNLVIQAVSSEKDVDGFNYINAGKLFLGDKTGFIPCTAAAVHYMIEKTLGSDLSGLNSLVIGRSNIVGKPTAALLSKQNATVTLAHSRTSNISELCKNADIVVAAVGQPEFVQGSWIKPGATVIDVGINRIQDGAGKKIVGDVHFESAFERAQYITPVPNGVGPMTIAMLMANTLEAAFKSLRLEPANILI